MFKIFLQFTTLAIAFIRFYKVAEEIYMYIYNFINFILKSLKNEIWKDWFNKITT